MPKAFFRATREHRFATFQHLTPVHHTDGHSLTLERVHADGSRHYLLTTRGRLEDADLDFMCNGQKDSHAKTVLCQEGLRAQLMIEQSEPLTSCKATLENNAPDMPVEQASPEQAPVRAAVPSAFGAVSGNRSTSSGSGGARSVAMAVVMALTLGLVGCGNEKPEPVKVSVVATKPLTRSTTHLPESVLDLLAPPKPLAGKYVPIGEIVRLDLAGESIESLAPDDTANGAQKALQAAWQIESAELELAKSADSLHLRAAGLAAKAADELDAQTAAKRIVEFVAAARKEGREVLAISKLAKDGAVEIARGVTIEARATAKDAASLIDEKLKTGAPANMVVLLDPPVFGEPTPLPKSASTPSPVTRTEGNQAAPLITPTPAAPQSAPPSEPHIVAGPGSTTMVIVNPGSGEKPEVTFQLPEGSRQIGNAILFDNNSARISDKAERTIDAIADAVKRIGGRRVILVAGADPVGSEKENLELAARRGAVTKAAFIVRGLMVDSLIPVGDCLTPSKTPREQRAEFRAVKVYTTDPAATAQR